jgi:hypothetical protein
MICPSSLPDDPKFYEMLNVIHVDDKWYNASKKNRKFYLLPDEEDPHRTVQNKNAIDKVMFFSGVALPRWNDEGVCTFNGKLGMWAFVKKVCYTHTHTHTHTHLYLYISGFLFTIPTPRNSHICCCY